jgi:hypothetical protein
MSRARKCGGRLRPERVGLGQRQKKQESGDGQTVCVDVGVGGCFPLVFSWALIHGKRHVNIAGPGNVAPDHVLGGPPACP